MDRKFPGLDDAAIPPRTAMTVLFLDRELSAWGLDAAANAAFEIMGGVFGWDSQTPEASKR